MTIQEWCLQYSEWKDICSSVKLGGWISGKGIEPEWKDDISIDACRRERCSLYVRIIEESCETNDILLVITEDIPPEFLGLETELVNNTYRIIENKLKIIRR